MNDPTYSIHTYGDPVLRAQAEPVAAIDDGIRDLVEGMLDVMFEENGVGLAAPQVGVSKRLVIVDFSAGEDFDHTMPLINPEIVEREGEDVQEEGCLSVPGIYEEVARATRIRLRWQDMEGIEHDEVIEGYPARIVQHELDHLDGILFTDRLSTVTKTVIARKLKDLAGDSQA